MCALHTEVEKNCAIRIKHGGFDLSCVQISDEGRPKKPMGMWVSKRDGTVDSYLSSALVCSAMLSNVCCIIISICTSL